jgi:hypothetical protein
MVVLITQDDVRTVRNLFEAYSTTAFEGFVLEMQESYLMPLLGVALYQDLITTPASAENVILLNGKIYDNGSEKVSMKGVKKYLVYLFLFKFVMEGNIKYSQSGTQDFEVDYSQRSPKGKDANVIQNHLSQSESIGAEIQLFLERNTATYPLYEFESSMPNKHFNFTVAGDTYIPFNTI